MSGIVFLAVIGAAVLHAVWNAVVKGSGDKTLSLTAVVIGHVPAALLALPFVPAPSVASLPYIGCGLFLHFGYQIFLLKAYQIGDLTQVYPIARGSAPLIVAVVSVLVLGSDLSGMQLLAVIIIATGIMSLVLVRRAEGQSNPKAAVFALITGLFIASYSMVDGVGARLSGSPLGYFAWLAIGNGLVMALYIARMSPATLTAVPRAGLITFLLGGTASFAAYAIVTWAYTLAPIALVSALRETSIIFAMLIGVFFLKERLNLTKLLATMATLLGAILLRYAK